MPAALLFLLLAQQHFTSKDFTTELLPLHSANHAIVRLSGPALLVDRLYIFTKSPTGQFHYSGLISNFTRNDDRQARLDTSTGKPILILSAQGTYGSTVSSERHLYYDISGPTPKLLHTASPQGFEERLVGPDRKYTATVTLHPTPQGLEFHTTTLLTLSSKQTAPHTLTLKSIHRNGHLLSATCNNQPLTPADYHALLDLDPGPSNETLRRYATSK